MVLEIIGIALLSVLVWFTFKKPKTGGKTIGRKFLDACCGHR